MKLWVDDVRPAPDGWHWAKTVTEAIRILATMPVEEVSLDHDIMHLIPNGLMSLNFGADKETVNKMMEYPVTCPETYEPVARYIAAMSDFERPKVVTLHTWNTDGAIKMKGILEDHLDPGKIQVWIKRAKTWP